MNVSLICACKNRYDALIICLNSWLLIDEIKEFIIVDWSSDVPIDSITKIDSRIKVIRVSDKKYFNQPQPLNLAASIATGDYILKVDTDYLFNPYYNFIEKYHPEDGTFVSGRSNYKNVEYRDQSGAYVIDKNSMSFSELYDYANSYSPYFKYLTGLLLIKKEDFNSVGGYNENLGKCYAYEDEDIFERLLLFGLKEKRINLDYCLLHLPHQDKKRIENFEGFEWEKEFSEQVRTNLASQHTEEELQWQIEYAISQKHVELNRELIGKAKNYYVEQKTKWNIKQLDDQKYTAEEILLIDEDGGDKMKEFPTVYCLSLEESESRRSVIQDQFSKYNITPNFLISKRFSDSNDKIKGEYVYQLNDGTKGCCVSHLKAIKDWYENYDEDYAFFCEDDLSLETVDLWNFTWEEFVEKIPEDADCVQLLTIRSEYDTFEIRERYWDDWSATAYILTRDCAKKIIDTFIEEETYNLEVPNQQVMPLIENILFSSVSKTYTVPLFVENVDFKSTFENQDDDVSGGQKTNHRNARNLVLEYWRKKSNQIKPSYTKREVQKTELEQLIYEFSLDTENPEHNFNLGVWYENQCHTAPALSYFLRCAERAAESDKTLAYEALIRGSYCYFKQGTRDGSGRGMLWQAQMLMPNRPEAYFLLARYAERQEWWQDCYSNCELALLNCDFNLSPLRTNVEYPGKQGILFEKAVSGWWWGKSEQSRDILKDLLSNYNLNSHDYNLIIESLKNMGVDYKEHINVQKKEFSFEENFDWSALTYEDIITIEREIVHEKVYRYWNDVKEGDVVLDIGASVGAYTISILDQLPKKVYCVEPSSKLLETLVKNCSQKLVQYFKDHKDKIIDNPLVCINRAIVDSENDKINIFGGEEKFTGITFKNLIKEYNIDHVDYLKIDCEGGEYSIFKEENMDFLMNSVGFIAAEIHLNYQGCREKFKKFRDEFLVRFKNYKVISCTRQNISWGNNVDLKERIFDNQFIDEYTCEFMIYIFNK